MCGICTSGVRHAFTSATKTVRTHTSFESGHYNVPHVKLKSSMRFTKCDTCTLANAALDRLRIHGGPEWRTSEAGPIERLVCDHHKVRRPSYRVVSSLFVFVRLFHGHPVRHFDAQHILSGGHPTHRQGCRTDISSVSLSCLASGHYWQPWIPHGPQAGSGSDSTQVLCVAIDGSDQSSYALPFFPQVGVSVSATVSFVAAVW